MIGPSDAFVWGSGGAQLTPAQIDAQRKVAQALMAQGSDYSPVQSWTQGASRVAQAIFGGMQARDANDSSKANMTAEARVLASIPTLISGGTASPVPGVESSPNISRPMGRLSIPTPSDKIYSQDEVNPIDVPQGTDRDLAIRTVLAEAGDQGPVGLNAVASVIRNRAVNGGYGGNTPSGVVTAPNQFEPWNTAGGRSRMAAIDSNGSQYAAAGRALDQAYAGNDPTNGATMFYGPKVQADLGRQPPSWDNGTGVDIGGHRFFGGVPQSTRVAMADPATANDGQPMAFSGSQPSPPVPTQQVAQAASPVPGFVSAPTVSPALLSASMDPRFSEGTRKILGAIATQQMESQLKQRDPAYQADLQIKQGQVSNLPLEREAKEMAIQELREKLRGMPLDRESKQLAIDKARRDSTPVGEPYKDDDGNLVQKDALNKITVLRPAPNKGLEFGAVKKDQFGNEILGWRDPRTMKVYDQDGNPLPTAGSAPAQATVTGPDGKQLAIPEGVDPKAFRTEVSKATADAATGKKTEVQAKAESFANRMEKAESVLAGGLEKEGIGPSASFQSISGNVPVLGSYMQSGDFQRYTQAKSQFITALLRQESGAAIGEKEFARYDKEFFPQPGDKKETIEQKAQARLVAIEAMKKGAGPSYKSPVTSPSIKPASPTGKTSSGVAWSIE